MHRQNEQSTTRQTTFLTDSEDWTDQRRAEYATERAKVLFGCYRRGDANDPDQYVLSIAAVLSLYPPDLIREITDPRTGISTDPKFCDYMPNSGQLKVICDGICAKRARYAELAKIPRSEQQPVLRDFDTTTPGRRANCFYPTGVPGYENAVEWSQTADPADHKLDEQGRPGIWVNGLAFTGNHSSGRFATPTSGQLLADSGRTEREVSGRAAPTPERAPINESEPLPF